MNIKKRNKNDFLSKKNKQKKRINVKVSNEIKENKLHFQEFAIVITAVTGSQLVFLVSVLNDD